MNDFDYDIVQKKRVARGAFAHVNRKRGSMKYTKEVIDKIRPEGYYYEHFGFGTFLFNDKAK